MKHCDVDHSVYYHHKDGQLIIILTSVDNLTILASLMALNDLVKVKIHEAFKITDMGELHWILGIQVTRDRAHRTISLSQHAYIESIAQEFDLENAAPSSIPMDTLSITGSHLLNVPRLLKKLVVWRTSCIELW